MKTLKINIIPYGEIFYYLTYRNQIQNLDGYIVEKFFYRKEIMGWISAFLEITETSSALCIWDDL